MAGRSNNAPAQDEVDLVEMAEAELVRLQRQYRIMETERESYSVESSGLLARQREMISRLEQEKHEILVNLSIATSMGNERRDSEQEEIIARELRIHTTFEEAIKKEKLQLSELDVQIFRLEKDVVRLRMQDQKNQHSTQEAISEQRAISNLENRLHVATVKFNEMLQQNKVLRDEIDHLLKERSHFNELYQQLVARLSKGKKVMMDLIEQATLAYDQREEAQIKLQSLKERGRQDFLHQSHEMRELQRKLDHDTKLQEFLGIKGQKRIMADLEAREAQKKRQQREASERLIDKYQAILDQIRKFTDEEDIDRIAAKFIKQEEENFALFNYVNELNNELQALQEQVEDLRNRIDEQRVVNSEREQQQQQRVESLQEELEKAKKAADAAQARLKVSKHTIDKLLSGIENLFKAIRCDSSPLLELLGENTQVMPFNVMLYLSIIERRAIELMNVALFTESYNDPCAVPIEPTLPELSLRHVPVDVIAPTQS